MAMENLFATNSNVEVSSSRNLSGTAQLTSISGSITATIIDAMNADIDSYLDALKASQTDSRAMDSLIESFDCYKEADIEFLHEISEDVIEGMLKSQQSKGSSCKSKTMTLDNYRSLMTAAIAEGLIRKATGKEKHAVGTRRTSGSLEYTAEELEQLSADQDKLRKEIRNIQSKKSIMKSKAGFSEDDERWITLCSLEQQLKDMRETTGREKIVKVDATANALSDMLGDVDVSSLKASDSKALLAQIAALINTDTDVEPEEEAETEE